MTILAAIALVTKKGEVEESGSPCDAVEETLDVSKLAPSESIVVWPLFLLSQNPLTDF